MNTILLSRHIGDTEKMNRRLRDARHEASKLSGEVVELIEPVPATTSWYDVVERVVGAIMSTTRGDLALVVGSCWDLAPNVEECVQRISGLSLCPISIVFVEEGFRSPIDRHTLTLFPAMMAAIKSGQVRQAHFEDRSDDGRSRRSQISEKLEAQIRQALEEGTKSVRQLALDFEVNRRTVIRIKNLIAEARNPISAEQAVTLLACASEEVVSVIERGPDTPGNHIHIHN